MIYTYFPGKERDCVFYDVSLCIDMMPECFSCLNQIQLDSPRQRACTVTTFKHTVSRVVQGEYQGEQLGIANCRGDNTESLIIVQGISHPKGFTSNLPKRAELHIMIYIVLVVIAA